MCLPEFLMVSGEPPGVTKAPLAKTNWEVKVDRALTKRVGVAVTAAALAASVSALFGGVAFAHGGHSKSNFSGGNGGAGGTTAVNCPLPIVLDLGIASQVGGNEQCRTTGSTAGAGGAGAVY
jgi:hypothetical protein